MENDDENRQVPHPQHLDGVNTFALTPTTNGQQPIIPSPTIAPTATNMTTEPLLQPYATQIESSHKKKLPIIIAGTLIILFIITACIIYFKQQKKTITGPNQTTKTNTDSTQKRNEKQDQRAALRGDDFEADISLVYVEQALRIFGMKNNYYPSEINATLLPSAADDLTLPNGYRFDYAPEPQGCKTSNKDCNKYIIAVLRPAGEAIETIKSPGYDTGGLKPL